MNKQLDVGHNVVIDTNTYFDDFEKTLKSNSIKKILVYAPLSILLKRDAKRTKNLRRNDKRAEVAKKFVIENFANFFTADNQLSGNFSCDICVDTSIFTIDELTEKIIEFLQNKS